MSVNMKLKATSKITMTWFYLVIIMILQTSSAKDTIFPNQTLKDGNTIISPGEFFELGFFSTGNSSLRYLGIWYRSISRGTVVWVANRQVPLADPTGELKLNETGSLHLLTANNNLIWSSSRSSNVTNLVARLLDSGNFVVRDDISGELVWQSFDHPGDTFMPGMKLGVSLETGVMWNLTSWKTSDDPSAGSYTVFMDTNGYPQLYNKRFESDFQQRLGFWNGRGFTGVLGFKQNNIYTFEFVWNEVEIYFMYHLVNTSVSRMTLSNNGTLERLVWIERTNSWVTFMSVAKDKCDEYGLCGSYGSCTIQNSPACACLEGFEPKLPEEWSVADWSNGCKLDVSINYENNFKRFTNLKLPDTRDAWFNTSLSLDECENLCRRNISCTAYANTDIRLGGSGCLLWFKELIDIRDAGQGDVSGQDIYIKMVNPYSNREEKKNKSHLKVTLSIALPVVLVLVGFILIFYARRNKKQKSHHKDETLKQDSNLPFFSLKEVVKATDNFSMNNKLGQGGFGAVYKGVLENGGEIAVKRLSKTSKQGVVEFQNEVICIAKLQHRNLVKLLGCCVQGEEMMLIYEYLPNKSLDYFLFDGSSSLLLDWPQRYHIINGIARGIVYLHQDSRLRIIHRDLKASNILLDSNMNPKISDFGLARMFKEYETEANTGKVAGTLGYMSPEYVAGGLFSVKSDAFSFGVLVLEIVSGKKNSQFYDQYHDDNLIGHAWRLYKENKPLELVDAALGDSWDASEVLRSIHVGLSCVQHHANDRPNMSSVVHMLGGDGALPLPKQPAFFRQGSGSEIESTLIIPELPVSINEVTISLLDAR